MPKASDLLAGGEEDLSVYVNGMMDTSWAELLRSTLDGVPGSVPTFAAEAGISRRLLARVLAGEQPAPPDLVRALVQLLDRRAAQHAEAAQRLRRALQNGAATATIVVDAEHYILGCMQCGALWVPNGPEETDDEWTCPKCGTAS